MDEIEKNEELEQGATAGAEDATETGETGADDASQVGADDASEGSVGGATSDVEVAEYKITGLVDTTDEQGNITGQLPIGSVQELPVVVGDKAVSEGRAEKVE